MEMRFLHPGDDQLAVSSIYERSWKYAYKGIVSQEYLDSIPEGRWANHLSKEGMHHLVLLEDGILIGTASISRSRWQQHSDFGEIVSIYFLPEYIGQGYGHYLLNRCITELQGLGFSDILLWVLEDNARARAFYEKNGFICSGKYLQDTIGGKELREVMYMFHCGQSETMENIT